MRLLPDIAMGRNGHFAAAIDDTAVIITSVFLAGINMPWSVSITLALSVVKYGVNLAGRSLLSRTLHQRCCSGQLLNAVASRSCPAQAGHATLPVMVLRERSLGIADGGRADAAYRHEQTPRFDEKLPDLPNKSTPRLSISFDGMMSDMTFLNAI